MNSKKEIVLEPKKLEIDIDTLVINLKPLFQPVEARLARTKFQT